MIDQSEIQIILADVLSASKDLYVVKENEAVWVGIPNYYEGYKDAVEQKNRICTHAEVDKYPELLFKHRAPNQNDEEDEYIRNNYKNTTNPVFMDYLSVTSRGLNDNNWHIEYPEGSGEAKDYNEYILEDIDVFGSVENYVKNLVPTLRGKDANGVFTFEIKPPKMVEVDGELVQDDTERLDPQPKYYGTEQVVAWKWSTYGMFESFDKSVVEYNGKPRKFGRIFYFYDDTNIWKITQYGKFIDHTFDIEVVFSHELGEFPCHKLKGVPSINKDGSIYYTSRFYYAVDLLDWSLLYANYLNAAIANTCFPFRWMAGDTCDFQDSNGVGCHDGYVFQGEGEKRACPKCGGAGMIPRTSSMGTYLLKPKQGQDDGDTSFSAPVGFVSPQTDTLEFTRDMSKQYMEDSKQMLHIHTSNSNVKGSEDMTATGMAIDMKAMFAFVQPDSDQTFDVFQFLLDITGKVREGKDFEGAVLTYPKTFDFRTDADILADIRIAREAGAPTHIVNTLIHQYITSRFYAETDTAKVSQVITSADRLLTLSNEEIIQRKAQNAVNNWEIVLHDSAFTFINELISENPDFLELEVEEMVSQLIARAKDKTPTELSVTRAQERANSILGG